MWRKLFGLNASALEAELAQERILREQAESKLIRALNTQILSHTLIICVAFFLNQLAELNDLVQLGVVVAFGILVLQLVFSIVERRHMIERNNG